MTQKTLGEMADRGYGKMSEESGYVLHELKNALIGITAVIEKKADAKDLDIINQLADKVEALPEMVSSINILTSKINALDEVISSINSVSDKVEAIKEALKILAGKLDGEDVANLDTDYLNAVGSVLV